MLFTKPYTKVSKRKSLKNFMFSYISYKVFVCVYIFISLLLCCYNTHTRTFVHIYIYVFTWILTRALLQLLVSVNEWLHINCTLVLLANVIINITDTVKSVFLWKKKFLKRLFAAERIAVIRNHEIIITLIWNNEQCGDCV